MLDCGAKFEFEFEIEIELTLIFLITNSPIKHKEWARGAARQRR